MTGVDWFWARCKGCGREGMPFEGIAGDSAERVCLLCERDAIRRENEANQVRVTVSRAAASYWAARVCDARAQRDACMNALRELQTVAATRWPTTSLIDIAERATSALASLGAPAAVCLSDERVNALRRYHWGEEETPDSCTDPECAICGILLCPRGAPEHMWRDGCPACHELAAIAPAPVPEEGGGE